MKAIGSLLLLTTLLLGCDSGVAELTAELKEMNQINRESTALATRASSDGLKLSERLESISLRLDTAETTALELSSRVDSNNEYAIERFERIELALEALKPVQTDADEPAPGESTREEGYYDVLLYSAEWCGPCREYERALCGDSVEHKQGEITYREVTNADGETLVLKVICDENAQRQFPTIRIRTAQGEKVPLGASWERVANSTWWALRTYGKAP